MKHDSIVIHNILKRFEKSRQVDLEMTVERFANLCADMVRLEVLHIIANQPKAKAANA